jgi:hypothetical protein
MFNHKQLQAARDTLPGNLFPNGPKAKESSSEIEVNCKEDCFG